MGVPNELILAPEGSAGDIVVADKPLHLFEGVDAEDLDSAKLARLHSLAVDVTLDDVLPLYSPLIAVGEEGPSVVIIPVQLVSRLASLDDVDSAQLAQRWARTEEFASSEESDVVRQMDSIRELAKKATMGRAALFLRVPS